VSPGGHPRTPDGPGSPRQRHGGKGRHRASPQRLVGTVIAIAAFLTTIDNTIVNVALPSIQRDLRMSLPALQWVVTGYLVTFSALMLTGGRLADRYGRRRILLGGLALFTGASLLAGVASNAVTLLTARAIQGAGAALVLPSALAVAGSGRTARERDAAAAVWMAALAAALAMGPVVGGWLSQHLGWHWVFLVNIPPGVAGLLIGRAAIEDTRENAAAGTDVAGLVCSTAALAAMTFVLIEGPSIGWASARVATAALITAVAAGFFGLAERRARDPMIDPGLVRERVLQGGIAASVLWGAGINGVFFFTSLFLQRAAGFSATRTGLVFLPLAALVVLVTPFTPGLTARFGAARTVATGLVVVAVGLALLALATIPPIPALEALPALPPLGAAHPLLAHVALAAPHVTLTRMLPGIVIIGVGSALTVPLTSSVLAAVPPSRTGVAGGILSLAREASGLVGISVIGLIVTAGRPASARGAVMETIGHGYGVGLLTAAGLAAAGAVVARLTLPDAKRLR
jgi:EmrB/QacA subfamily drug resistance transporter